MYEPDAPVVTEIRRLLQNLARASQAAERSIERKVYLVTSAARGEGKSTIAGMLSLVAAQVFRKRTLLIDGDLRRPTVHSILGLSQRPGLFELFRGLASPTEAIRPTAFPTLSVLPSGSPTGAMGEAYDDDKFADLLAKLRPQYDLIFIDSAPAVPVVEPLMMAEHADAVLLVAMAGKTPVTMMRRLKQVIAPVNDRVIGLILNNAAEGLPYYYEYRYYGYERPGKRKHRRVRSKGHAEENSDGASQSPGGTP